ncbi:MAG: hypothetical protein IT201_10075 [Thermoleophilia bacterium]|nr:hypothetical protein [Thermoleophilia bacterium]
MSEESLAELRAEFEEHVWDHSVDAFQKDFDVRRPLTDTELEALQAVAGAIAKGESDEDIAALIRRLTLGEPKTVLTLMQIVGLTRNKIITDLRASTAAKLFRVPGDPLRLPSSGVWPLAGLYLAERLRRVLEPLCQMNEIGDQVFEALNQATHPGWIRQERAKRQGHEAEYRLANVLFACGIPFVPVEKTDNPLCRDALINGVSFDLVVPDVTKPRVVVKSTVHTANIGQFGESKDALEINEAAAMIESNYATNARPTLLALIDGVGFRSNRAGLDGVLSEADEFCQFRSLWKGVVVAAFAVERALVLALPADHIHDHARFLDRYSEIVEVEPLTDEFRASVTEHPLVEAGEGVIRLD